MELMGRIMRMRINASGELDGWRCLSVVDLRTISAGLGQGLGVESANRDNYHCGGELDMQ